MTPNADLEPLDARDCLLLLVDIQKIFLDPCPGAEALPGNAAALIEIADILEIPVLFTVHNAEKLGGMLPELTGKAPRAAVLDKLEFNCFENEGIARAVLETGRKTLLLAGLEAHVCVFHTGAAALRLGYRVHVAADAVASRSHFNRDIGLARARGAGAVISSTEMVIYELLKRAGTPEFRAALPVLKRL